VKQIVDITTNDWVLTRRGYRRVLKAWCKGTKKVITRFGITATPDHKIYTTNRGWVSLDSLSYEKDHVVNAELSSNPKCQYIESALKNVRTTDKHDVQEKNVPVYDLMVEDQHEFFAYGILAHNCDALAYADQIANVGYFADELEVDTFVPLDDVSGY